MKITENTDNAQADALLQHQIGARKTPGLYYAFFDAGRILHEFSGGEADLKNEIPVDAQTVFYGYSVTKTFTATAVLQLAEQGKLHLDDPVKKYLPSFVYGGEIRIRHLLAHSAGLPNPLPISWIHRAEDDAGFDGNAFFQNVFQKNPKARSKPNDKFAYTNLGYVALGELVEQVSGIPYRRYVEQHILKPLGVSEQIGFVRQSHWKMAIGYQKVLSFGNLLLSFFLDKKRFMGENTKGWRSFLPFYLNGSAYGGLIGAPGAFIAFAQDLLKPNSVLLSPESRKEMFRENLLNGGKTSGMCLAWFCGELNGRRFVAHAGGGGGYYCELRIYPENGLGSIMMTNRTGFSDERLLSRFDRFFIT